MIAAMPASTEARRSAWVACGLVIALVGLGAAATVSRQTPARIEPARRLPERIPDADFWRLVTEMSEPGGSFHSDNFTSNEPRFPDLVAALAASGSRGGAYLGVGPEQNFNYIVALRPDVAFVIDIRRQAVMQHLLYKAIVEMSADRVEFLSLLFSVRKRRAPTARATTRTSARSRSG